MSIIEVKSPWPTLEWNKLIPPKENVKIYNDVLDIGEYKASRVFFNLEPEAIIHAEKFLIDNWKKFKIILTFNKKVLAKCKNAVKFYFGGTWLSPHDFADIDVSKKEFKISLMCGSKQMAIGHKLRLDLYYNQKAFVRYPIDFWRSSAGHILPEINAGKNPLLGKDRPDKINMLRTYQYHFAIENSRQTNYFSEKLIDCLLTKTIPIYYGCPNISDIFDTTGWIILDDENIQKAFDKLAALTPEYYSKYLTTIEKNYNIAKEYMDIEENVNRALREPGCKW